MAWKPGKGLHAILNEATFAFLVKSLDEVRDTGFDNDMIDHDADGILDALEAEGWKKSKDKFGDKRYVETRHGEDMLRVTVVKTSRDDLKLDIRLWYNDEA